MSGKDRVPHFWRYCNHLDISEMYFLMVNPFLGDQTVDL